MLFDDCHRPYPKLGKQPLPVKGVHNSGWKQSPGMELVNQVDQKKRQLVGMKNNHGWLVATFYQVQQSINLKCFKKILLMKKQLKES